MRLSELRAGWTAAPIRAGIALSGATIERWTSPGRPDRFHKAARPTWDRGLDAEAARLRWLATTPLADRVATVVHHSVDEDGVEHLVTTAVGGTDAAGLADLVVAGHDAAAGRALALRYGRALRELHDTLDLRACPFDRRLDVRLADAERRAGEGGVDVDDFEPRYAGWTAGQVLDELRATRPDGEDLVVTHGDWCFPNVLFEDGEDAHWWGMVDVADLGVGCRWYDVGIGARSTMHNLGDGAVPAFLEGYGLGPDEDRMRWYVLLDELQ